MIPIKDVKTAAVPTRRESSTVDDVDSRNDTRTYSRIQNDDTGVTFDDYDDTPPSRSDGTGKMR